MLGAEWAANHGVPLQHFPAYWDKYGKSAGFIRNAEMGEYADALIAFWDGVSPGTKHMIQTMKRNKKPYWVYDYNGTLVDCANGASPDAEAGFAQSTAGIKGDDDISDSK